MKTLTIGDLKARIPIIQGGMGVGISLSGLASAVANEGGIGVISAAGLGLLYKKLSPSNYTEAGNLGLAEEIRKAREKAKGIIGVNVMVALSDFAELVKTSIAEKVDIIFSGAGKPVGRPAFLIGRIITSSRRGSLSFRAEIRQKDPGNRGRRHLYG